MKAELSLILMTLTFGACVQDPETVSRRAATAGGAADALGRKGSCLKVTDGKATGDMPAVGMIATQGTSSIAVCTASFIAKNAIITAAHCLLDGSTGSIRYIAGDSFKDINAFSAAAEQGVESSQAIYTGIPTEPVDFKRLSDRVLDLAIVFFPKDIAPATLKISRRPVADKTDVTLVGYGRTSFTTDDPSVLKAKRVGHNKSYDRVDTGFIRLTGHKETSDPASDRSLAYKGDSGGPLLVNNNIVGVFSLYAESSATTDGLNYYVDLSTQRAQDLIERAMKEGGLPSPYIDDADPVAAANYKNEPGEAKLAGNSGSSLDPNSPAFQVPVEAPCTN